MVRKEVTIYDLAHTLKIFSARVSRGLNDDPVLKKKTRKAIHEAAKAPGYCRGWPVCNKQGQSLCDLT